MLRYIYIFYVATELVNVKRIYVATEFGLDWRKFGARAKKVYVVTVWRCVASWQRRSCASDRAGQARMTRLAHQGWVLTIELLCRDILLTVVKKKKGKRKSTLGARVSHYFHLKSKTKLVGL